MGLDAIARRGFLKIGALSAFSFLASGRVFAEPKNSARIFFTQGEGDKSEVWVMDDDGKNPRQITRNNYREISAAVSPDGKLLAYCVWRDLPETPWMTATEGDLHICDLLTGKETIRTDPTTYEKYAQQIVWSPDSKMIALVVGRGYMLHDGAAPKIGQPIRWYGIHTVDVYTNTKKVIFHDIREGNAMYPSFSPDGKHIAFAKNRNIIIDNQIIVDGERLKRVSSAPSWSPRGDKIIFVSDREKADSYKIYIMNPDGSNQEVLAPDEYLWKSGYPGVSWSPDGRIVAYKSGKNLHLVNVENRDVRKIVLENPDIGPHWEQVYWSPDCNALLLKANRLSEGKKIHLLCRINTDGSNLTVLKEGINEIIAYR